MFSDVLGYGVGHPDGDVELQVHLNVSDGKSGVSSIYLASFSSDGRAR